MPNLSINVILYAKVWTEATVYIYRSLSPGKMVVGVPLILITVFRSHYEIIESHQNGALHSALTKRANIKLYSGIYSYLRPFQACLPFGILSYASLTSFLLPIFSSQVFTFGYLSRGS